MKSRNVEACLDSGEGDDDGDSNGEMLNVDKVMR